MEVERRGEERGTVITNDNELYSPDKPVGELLRKSIDLAPVS